MANYNTIYSDLDLTFRKTPGKNDVAMSFNEQAVIRSVKNLLFTSRYERLFQPDIGSDINTLLFEPVSPLSASLLEGEITRLINNYEPRATIDFVRVYAKADENFFNATISFFVGNNTEPTAFNVLLKRSR